jgi:hypothetical protein
MGKPFFGMKNRRKSSLEIDDAIAMEVLGLLVSNSLQRLFRLHNGNGVRETPQILGQAALIRPAMEPFTEFLGIAGRKLCVPGVASELDDRLRPQYTVEVLVQ